MPLSKSKNLKLYKIRLKKGDTVMVRSGKLKGRIGKVLATHPLLNKVTVEGINVVKKHQKPNTQHPQGGIIELTKPIWVGKVGIVEPVSKKPSRISYHINAESGAKTRHYGATSKEIK